MRYRFQDIFRENQDGSLTPISHIKIGSANIGPGLSFKDGVSFGGVNIFDFKGKDIEAEQARGVLIIRGFYRET